MDGWLPEKGICNSTGTSMLATYCRTLWNSLPDIVVNTESVNSFSLREDWTDSGMITWKLNLIVKLTLKVPEVELI